MSVDRTKVSGATCAINERPGSAIYSKLLEFWTSLVSDAWSRQAAGSPLGTRITWKFHGGGAACYRFRRMRGWGSASLQNHSSTALAKIIQVRLRNCPLAGSLHRRQNSCPAQNPETRTSKLCTLDARVTGDNVWICFSYWCKELPYSYCLPWKLLYFFQRRWSTKFVDRTKKDFGEFSNRKLNNEFFC